VPKGSILSQQQLAQTKRQRKNSNLQEGDGTIGFIYQQKKKNGGNNTASTNETGKAESKAAKP